MVVLALVARDPFLFLVIWSVQHWSAAMGLASLAAGGGEHGDATRLQRLLAAVNRGAGRCCSCSARCRRCSFR
jgi:hypothetical protein